jgi:hypothetical protein
MVIMVFSMNVVNTKLVANFFILLTLKFHNHKPDGLGVIDFKSLLSGFASALNRSECLVCLTCVRLESCHGNNRSVVIFLSFPKC